MSDEDLARDVNAFRNSMDEFVRDAAEHRRQLENNLKVIARHRQRWLAKLALIVILSLSGIVIGVIALTQWPLPQCISNAIDTAADIGTLASVVALLLLVWQLTGGAEFGRELRQHRTETGLLLANLDELSKRVMSESASDE